MRRIDARNFGFNMVLQFKLNHSIFRFMRGAHYDKATHDRFKAQFMQAVNWWLSDEIREQIRRLKPIRRLESKAKLLEGELYS